MTRTAGTAAAEKARPIECSGKTLAKRATTRSRSFSATGTRGFTKPCPLESSRHTE